MDAIVSQPSQSDERGPGIAGHGPAPQPEFSGLAADEAAMPLPAAAESEDAAPPVAPETAEQAQHPGPEAAQGQLPAATSAEAAQSGPLFAQAPVDASPEIPTDTDSGPPADPMEPQA